MTENSRQLLRQGRPHALVRREAEWDDRSYGVPTTRDVGRSLLMAAVAFPGARLKTTDVEKAFEGLHGLLKTARKRHNRYWSQHAGE